MGKKGFLEISFAWLFALIVGAFVLFLAIYFVVKFIDVEQETQGAVTSTDIGIILNPLETGVEESKTTYLEMPVKTRIINGCSALGNFGTQTLRTSQMSFGKWTETNIKAEFQNKYIFSESNVEGEEFILFVKSFDFPFKVADLIYIIPKDKNYCFIGAPGDITKEIRDLNLVNVYNVTNRNSCPPESEKVCFSTSMCESRDTKVNLQVATPTVKKGNNISMVVDNSSLMYAAIFSDNPTYECQLERLILRQKQLLNIYNKKSAIVSLSNCDSNLNLAALSSLMNTYNSSDDMARITLTIRDIERLNSDSGCKLW